MPPPAPARRILFLADRNNLARQAESEFSTFNRTEGHQEMSSLYEIKRLKKEKDIKADIVISTIQKLFYVLTGNPIVDSDDEDAEDENNAAKEENPGFDVVVEDTTSSIKSAVPIASKVMKTVKSEYANK